MIHVHLGSLHQSCTLTSSPTPELPDKMVDSVVKDHLTKKRKKSTSKPHDTAAQAGPSKPSPSTARLFQPFRALGYVTNHVPFAMWVHTPRGALAKPAINIVTSVGKSWMMWNADKITLLFVGKESIGEIRGLVMNGTSVFASAGDRVTKYERGQEVGFDFIMRDELMRRCSDGSHRDSHNWARSTCLEISCLHSRRMGRVWSYSIMCSDVS
jgi:hypothetical protein